MRIAEDDGLRDLRDGAADRVSSFFRGSGGFGEAQDLDIVTEFGKARAKALGALR